jgi:O-antigen/teichoic acid export membrane protein
LLRRQMRFDVLAGIEILSLLLGVAVAMVGAVLGAGYWSLIFMSLAKAGGAAVGIWVACDWWPGRPRRRSGVREMLSFGANLTGFHVLNYFARNLDNVLIGKFWGADALGFYSKAYGLLMLPLTQINAPVSAAAIPALSRLCGEPVRYRSCYLRCISLIALVTMPLAVFLVVMSSEVTRVLLGPQWSQTSRIFMFLGIAALWQPVANSTGWLFVSQGRTADMFAWGIVGSSITVFGIVLGLPWGTTGVAASYTLFNGVGTPLLFWFVGRKGPVRACDIGRAVVTPLCMSLGVLVVLLALKLLCTGTTVPVTLICAGTTAAGIVVTLLFVLPGGSQIRADIRDISHTILEGC